MMSQPQRRPWYCREGVVEEYKQTLTVGGEDLPMLKTLKILRSIIVNVGIIGIGGYSIAEGAAPLLIGLVALVTLGLYNGLEISDYAAMLQAYREVQDASDGED